MHMRQKAICINTKIALTSSNTIHRGNSMFLLNMTFISSSEVENIYIP